MFYIQQKKGPTILYYSTIASQRSEAKNLKARELGVSKWFKDQNISSRPWLGPFSGLFSGLSGNFLRTFRVWHWLPWTCFSFFCYLSNSPMRSDWPLIQWHSSAILEGSLNVQLPRNNLFPRLFWCNMLLFPHLFWCNRLLFHHLFWCNRLLFPHLSWWQTFCAEKSPNSLLRTKKFDYIRVESWISPSFDPIEPLMKSF